MLGRTRPYARVGFATVVAVVRPSQGFLQVRPRGWTPTTHGVKPLGPVRAAGHTIALPASNGRWNPWAMVRARWLDSCGITLCAGSRPTGRRGMAGDLEPPRESVVSSRQATDVALAADMSAPGMLDAERTNRREDRADQLVDPGGIGRLLRPGVPPPHSPCGG